MEDLSETDFSLISLFVPLTTIKAITWILIIGIIVFGNMLFNGFVWDDKTQIILNPGINNFSLPYLMGQNYFNDLVNYRPIPAIYFTAFYSVFSTNTFFYHFFQLTIHILNTALLFIFFSSVFKKNVSFFLSLIFLVHPIQVESVSYITSTDNPLFFLFGISGLLITKKVTPYRLAQTNILLLLALLTKETGVIFFFLYNIYTFLYAKSKIWVMTCTTILTLLIYLLIRFFIGHVYFAKDFIISPIAHLSFQQRLLSLPSIVFYYIKTFLYPVNLSIDQLWVVTTPTITNFYFPLCVDLIFLLLIIFIGWKSFNNKVLFKLYIFFTAWLTIGFAFQSQLVPLDMTVADRWFYITIVGLLGLLGITFNLFSNITGHYTKLLFSICIVVICLLSLRTMVRNTNWNNAITLYTHDIAINDNYDLENNLGWEYIQAQQYDLAIPHLEKSIHFWSGWDKNWYNLGVAYYLTGRISSAKTAYETALQHNPDAIDHPQLLENLGLLLATYESPTNAKMFITKALSSYPKSYMLWYELALANYKLKNFKDAKNAISQAYILSPNNSNILNLSAQIANDTQVQYQH